MTCQCDEYNSGMLSEPVEIQRAARVSDGAGGFTETFAALSGAPTLGYVKARSGSERYASNRIEATSSWLLVVRYFSGLVENDIVVIRSRKYNIRFINNVELKDKWLEIDLSGGVAV